MALGRTTAPLVWTCALLGDENGEEDGLWACV